MNRMKKVFGGDPGEIKGVWGCGDRINPRSPPVPKAGGFFSYWLYFGCVISHLYRITISPGTYKIILV